MDAVRYYTQDIREKAKAYGRDPEQLLMFKGQNVVVGKTAGEAREKFEDYKKNIGVPKELWLILADRRI